MTPVIKNMETKNLAEAGFLLNLCRSKSAAAGVGGAGGSRAGGLAAVAQELGT